MKIDSCQEKYENLLHAKNKLSTNSKKQNRFPNQTAL